MILTCPECSARFAVPDHLVPPEGRTVKCGRCSHQWHADAPDDRDFAALVEEAAAIPEFEEAPKPSRKLPVVKKRPFSPRPFMFAVPCIALLWLILAFAAYYPSWMQLPGLRGIYKTFGMESTNGLVFQDAVMQRQTEGAKTQFLITGSIANQASEYRRVPTVRVQLKNKDGKTLWAREYPVNETLAAGDIYPFRIDNVETSFAASVTAVVLDIGHPLQLMMR